MFSKNAFGDAMEHHVSQAKTGVIISPLDDSTMGGIDIYFFHKLIHQRTFLELSRLVWSISIEVLNVCILSLFLLY